MLVQPLFLFKVDCLNCEMSYETSRVRASFKRTYKKDTDFCGYYKELNPEYYVVRVCPYCGFATTENFDNRLTKEQKQTYLEKIGLQWSMKNYCGERSWDDALQTFKLALLCGQIKQEKPRVIAGILHHIAWLYREKGQVEMENRFLHFALDAYIDVFENEQSDMNSARLMYILGELSRRLKKYSEAVNWFSRVINDKRIMDSSMIKACREQWAQTREDMIADKLELPEEMLGQQA